MLLFLLFTIHKLNSQRWFGSNVHYAAFIVPQQSVRTALFAFVIRFSSQFLFFCFCCSTSRLGSFIVHSYSLLKLCRQFNTQHTWNIHRHQLSKFSIIFIANWVLRTASTQRTRNEWNSMGNPNWQLRNFESKINTLR